MRRLVRIGSSRRQAEGQATPASLRDRLAMLLALVTVAAVISAFVLSKDMQFLMPGPLASAHGSIESCASCHTKSGSGKLSWLHGLVAGDRLADSKACLTCHRMPDTAFNAHGATADVLEQSTARLRKMAAEAPAPHSARAQSLVFPTDRVVARGLYCTTCHQEHQGANFKLGKITNEQCRSCHVVKFDSFDGHHPKFEGYPFKRRTRIIFDHAGHFGNHFPETAKKDPARRIPETCATCHDSGKDRRLMAVAPFEKTCTACHLDQIVGKERVSGPKGIAFLALPGLDLQTLKKRRIAIGEWPDASEAELTPFMKVMIGRSDRGRALIRSLDRVNLQDLSRASDAQLRAVSQLVWEIKGLFYALIKGTASDVLAHLAVGDGGKPSADLVADLTASIPRDVIVSSHQQWLPNLGREMANRKDIPAREQGSWITTATESGSAIESAAAQPSKSGRRAPTDRSAEADSTPDASAAKASTAQSEATAQAAESTSAKPGKPPSAADEPPRARSADQSDDLLFPTEEEQRAMKAGIRDTRKPTPPATPARKADAAGDKTDAAAAPASVAARINANAPEPPARIAPVVSIESNVDPESWAAYGGWYRQDFTIFYRPTGHKDKLIYSWLALTGPRSSKGDKSPAAAVFERLAGKDAQGSCTKCHSIDDLPGKGRVVNFSPLSADAKLGRFTNFVHEPHLGIMETRGCLTCHDLKKDSPYLKSYEQGDPHKSASSFGAVSKDLCQSCHTTSMARQDCLLCHKYHVHGVVTPTMSTRIPSP